MLNIIIYEDDKRVLKRNTDIVNLAFGDYEIDYRIHKFSNYSDELLEIIKNKELKKVYILDVEMDDVSGLELASLIREDDFESIIIFITAYDKYHLDVFNNRLMVLDFICKDEKYDDRLRNDIRMALKIIYDKNIFVSKYKRIIYRIPYSEINYIEKEPFIKRCIIHTLSNNFYIVNSIENIINELGYNFIRSHKSCIINVNNISNIDYVNNMIIFKNGDSTNLMNAKIRKELKLLWK